MKQNATQVNLPPVLTRREAADALRCSTAKIDRMIGEGKLSSTTNGRSRLIRAEDVARILNPHK